MEEDFDDAWPYGAEGDSKDVLTQSGISSADVSKLLSRADGHAGEYSFGGRGDTLPVAPGLFIDGLGAISTPLHSEKAEKLIALCEKSLFGHNMDTKMDEKVRKSWQLQPSLVQFKNPLWQTGIEALTKVIANRLGYKGVAMECVLYKLLVYGEGGHFLKHQDTEKEDGMIATLVVQPPSRHEGGDLVVYQKGEEKFRHDFGKSDGMAEYFPHYAVHYADAEHSLEEVTKGFRLALVYSICLPATMRHLERPRDESRSEDLAKAISKMDGDDDSFALLLVHEYTEKSIRNLGWGALKGVDSARFHALNGANAVVPKEKQLLFFIAQLHHNVFYCETGEESEKQGHGDAITWYTTAGDGLGAVSDVKGKLNFLNPGQETLQQLWDESKYSKITKHGGYIGNEGSTQVTTYTRCAIVAWQMAKHPGKAMKLMSPEAAALALQSSPAVDGALVRQLLDAAKDRLDSENKIKFDYYRDFEKDDLSMEFYRLFSELLAKTDDSKVAALFFEKHCPYLGGVDGNDAFIPSITRIVRRFDWAEIGEAVLETMTMTSKDENDGLSPMELALHVLDGQDEGAAAEALLKRAVENAETMDDSALLASDTIGLLLKWIARSEDKSLFDSVVKKLTNADASLVGPSIQYLLQYLSESEKEKLAPIVAKRAKWLEDQIQELDTKFTWEMPNASVSESTKPEETDEAAVKDKVETFLRDGDVSMTTKGVKRFNDFQEAQDFASKYPREKQKNCSFEMEATKTDREVLVTITKTREWFLMEQKKLVQYQTELRLLKEKFGEDFEATGDEKRTRR